MYNDRKRRRTIKTTEPYHLRRPHSLYMQRRPYPGSDAAPSEAADDDKANAPERVRHELRRPSPRRRAWDVSLSDRTGLALDYRALSGEPSAIVRRSFKRTSGSYWRSYRRFIELTKS